MLKSTFTIILAVIASVSFSQKHIIIDSSTNKIIQFVTIKFENNGLYSNEKGEFLYDTKKMGKISFQHINYYSLEIDGVNCGDTIKLKPKSNQLAELIIVARKGIKKIAYLKQAKSYSSFPLNERLELISFLSPRNNEIINSDVKKIFFRGASAKGIKDDTSFKSVIRVNFYNVESEKIVKIYSSEPIYVLPNTDREYSVDLSKQFIEFSQNGFAVGIENIGVIDKGGNFIEMKNHIRIALTNKSSKDYKQITYLKYTFSGDAALLSINKALNIDTESYMNYNLLFRCELF